MESKPATLEQVYTLFYGLIFLFCLISVIGYYYLSFWFILDLTLFGIVIFIHLKYFSEEEYDCKLESWKNLQFKNKMMYSYQDFLLRMDKDNIDFVTSILNDMECELWQRFQILSRGHAHIVYSDNIKELNIPFKVEYFYELKPENKWFNHFKSVMEFKIKLDTNSNNIYIQKLCYDNFESQNSLKVKYFDELNKPLASTIIECVKKQDIDNYIIDIINNEKLPKHLTNHYRDIVVFFLYMVPVLTTLTTIIIKSL